MLPLFAGTPPMPLSGRLIVAMVGFGLVLTLSCLSRGIPSFGRCAIGAIAVLFSVLAINSLGVPDDRGILAILIGISGAVFAQRPLTARTPDKPQHAKWLAAFCAPIGLALGLCLFGMWYGQSEPADHFDAGWYAVVFAGIGFFSGAFVSVVVSLRDGT